MEPEEVIGWEKVRNHPLGAKNHPLGAKNHPLGAGSIAKTFSNSTSSQKGKITKGVLQRSSSKVYSIASRLATLCITYLKSKSKPVVKGKDVVSSHCSSESFNV